MSKYAEVSTELRDETFIVAALRAMGYVVEAHDQPVTAYGYHDQVRSANIIVRKQHSIYDGVSQLGDVGFLREADGTYRLIVDDYHPEQLRTWIGRVKQNYMEARQMAIAKQRGYIFKGRQEVQTDKGKQVKLLFAVR